MNRLSLVAAGTLLAMLATFAAEASAADIRVKCEVRANRSKISIDGRKLGSGNFSTQAVSGQNIASSAPLAAVAGEVETDYDSSPGDIAEGAIAVPASFIVGGQVTGKVIDAAGFTVASDTVACRVKK